MYRQISKFAPKINNSYSNDPLLYCTLDSLDSQFLHGSQGRIFGRYNEGCAQFMSDRCAANWDEVCEAMSKDKEMRFPNTISNNKNDPQCSCLPYGEQLIRNSAYKKYRVESIACNVVCKPHDPTVPNSPIVCMESKATGNSGPNNYDLIIGNSEGGSCEGIYKLVPEQIKNLDNDKIMNHILNKPNIAMDLLEKIYKTMAKEDTLYQLKNTRLGKFYEYLGNSVPQYPKNYVLPEIPRVTPGSIPNIPIEQNQEVQIFYY